MFVLQICLSNSVNNLLYVAAHCEEKLQKWLENLDSHVMRNFAGVKKVA